ncbi:MAG: transporter substrate-binding domain-containing protein [Anaerolineae bacterium]|nr:transporter substrate-binding domain-containing protein [Anaerolineae bacterium]
MITKHWAKSIVLKILIPLLWVIPMLFSPMIGFYGVESANMPFQTSGPDALTIRVGFYENPPKLYTDENGNFTGFWPDLVHYIALEEGWVIEWVPGTWEESLGRLENGKIDIMPDVAYNEERSQKYDFSTQKVLISWSRLYVQEGLEIETVLDLDGKVVAGLKGSVNYDGAEGIQDLVNRFGLRTKFVDLDNYTEVFEAIENKEVDAGVTNKDFGNSNERNYAVDRTSFIFQPTHIEFALPKDSPLTPLLIERIEEQIKTLKENDQSIYYELLEKYLEERSAVTTVEVLPDWARNSLWFGGGIILALLVVSGVSRSQIRQKTGELRQTEGNYHTLFEQSADGIFILDENNHTLDVNQMACQILGFSKEELLAINTSSLIHPDDLTTKDHATSIEALYRGDTIYTEYRLKTKKTGPTYSAELSTETVSERVIPQYS